MSPYSPALCRFQNILKSPVFAIIWFSLAAVSYFTLDLKVALLFQHLPSETLRTALSYISQFGKADRYIIALIGLFILYRTLFNRLDLANQCLYLLCAIIVSGVLCDILKVLFGRARPIEWFSHQIYGFQLWQWHVKFWSFPSGHSTTISALMMGLALCYPRAWLWCGLPILAVVSSRVMLTEHYISDVMVGMYIGLLTSALLARKFCKSQTFPQTS